MNESIDPNDPRYALACEGHPTAEQMEESAAITRTYFMKGLWHWLPGWETIGEPERYPSHQVSPYPIGHHLHTWL